MFRGGFFMCVKQFSMRVILYVWLSLLVILRFDMLLDKIYIYLYAYLSIIVLLSLFFSWKDFDKKVFDFLAKKKRFSVFVYMVFAVVWVQLGMEWYFSIRANSYESFLYYEPIAIVLGFPSSILVLIVDQFFPDISDPKTYAVIIWLLYFLASMVQVNFIIRRYHGGRLRKVQHKDEET